MGCPLFLFFDDVQVGSYQFKTGKRFHKRGVEMAIVLLTNNPLVMNKLGKEIIIIYDENMSYVGILKNARDKIHKGAVLLTHPLSGSIKPSETPFKSVLLKEGGKSLDGDSLQIIEDAIRIAERMVEQARVRTMTETILADFQLIDYDLIRHGLEHARQHQ